MGLTGTRSDAGWLLSDSKFRRGLARRKIHWCVWHPRIHLRLQLFGFVLISGLGVQKKSWSLPHTLSENTPMWLRTPPAEERETETATGSIEPGSSPDSKPPGFCGPVRAKLLHRKVNARRLGREDIFAQVCYGELEEGQASKRCTARRCRPGQGPPNKVKLEPSGFQQPPVPLKKISARRTAQGRTWGKDLNVVRGRAVHHGRRGSGVAQNSCLLVDPWGGT